MRTTFGRDSSNGTSSKLVCTFLPEPYADIANFAYITGWRSAEIKDLQFRNLDFEAGEVRLEPGTTKSREGRAFPMFSELRVLLEKRLRLAQELRKKGVRCTHVFWYERNGEILPVGRFDKAWTTACRKAVLPLTERPLRRKNGEIVTYKRGPKKRKPIMVLKADAWFHDFRRTAIRNLERMGIPRSVAKLMVGHKTDSIYERYNVASKRDLDVAREKMERNAMERLYSTSKNPANSQHFARDGQSLGKVEPILGSSDAQNSAKLLEVNDGPVAQKDRAAVS